MRSIGLGLRPRALISALIVVALSAFYATPALAVAPEIDPETGKITTCTRP
jgi:hypothetical protein